MKRYLRIDCYEIAILVSYMRVSIDFNFSFLCWIPKESEFYKKAGGRVHYGADLGFVDIQQDMMACSHFVVS